MHSRRCTLSPHLPTTHTRARTHTTHTKAPSVPESTEGAHISLYQSGGISGGNSRLCLSGQTIATSDQSGAEAWHLNWIQVHALSTSSCTQSGREREGGSVAEVKKKERRVAKGGDTKAARGRQKSRNLRERPNIKKTQETREQTRNVEWREDSEVRGAACIKACLLGDTYGIQVKEDSCLSSCVTDSVSR